MGYTVTVDPRGRMRVKKNRESVNFGGVYRYEAIRRGRIFAVGYQHNIVTDEGLDYLLETGFNDGTKSTTWYVGLIQGATAPVSGDTLASFGFSEYNSYDEAARQQWHSDTASGGVITTDGANYAEFTQSETITITGSFLTDQATGTSGVLMSGSLFAGGVTLNHEDVLRIKSYTMTCTSS